MMWKTPKKKQSTFVKDFLKREHVGGVNSQKDPPAAPGQVQAPNGKQASWSPDKHKPTEFVKEFLTLSPEEPEEEKIQAPGGVLGI